MDWLRSLDEFLSLRHEYSKSEFVTHPDFLDLYVRNGPRYIRTTLPPLHSDGKKINPVITIARVEARVKGQGLFTKLLDYLLEKYHCPIYLECVHGERFQQYLLRRGFKEVAGVVNDFVLVP
jgi:hypothetical protein